MTTASLPKTVVNSIGMKFARIPAGTFLMGSPQDEKRRSKDEEQHEVELDSCKVSSQLTK
jgi:formylglycine-generating enzyme required for sulfatase activity